MSSLTFCCVCAAHFLFASGVVLCIGKREGIKGEDKVLKVETWY